MYLQSVFEKNIVVKNGNKQETADIRNWHNKTAAGGRAVTVIYGILLVAFSYNVEESGKKLYP